MSIKSVPRPSSTMAAQVVNARSDRDRKHILAVKKTSSDDCWEWFDELGEIHFSVTRSARIAGYARFKAVSLSPTSEIVTELESGAAADVASQIVSAHGGVRGLIERFYTQRKVCGDSWLIATRESKTLTGYEFLSPSEFVTNDSTTGTTNSTYAWRTLPTSSSADTNTMRAINRNDVLGRVWQAHPQYIDVADSPLMSMKTECELLRRSTDVLHAKMLNRLTLAGILYVASEIQAVASGDRRTQKPDEIVSKIIEIMTSRAMDPDQGAAAAAPILMRGPAAFVDAVKFISEDSDIYANDIAIRAELIERILFGLDINKTSTTGESQNRFQAWAASDDDRRIAVQPDLEDLCYALNKLVLWPQLRKVQGWDEEMILRTSMWYDLERSQIRANRSDDAKRAAELVLIGDEPAARDLGYGRPELITGDERVRRVGVLTKNPVLALYGTPEYDLIDWDLVLQTKDQPGPTGDPEDSPAGPGDTGGGPDDSDPQTPAEGDDPRDD
jgi:hypothetical protein